MKLKARIFALVLIITVGCNSTGHEHDNAHDHHSSNDSHHPHKGADDTPEHDLVVQSTIWTDQLELFVEYPALVAGKQSRFAIHFTRLENHQPVTEGSVKVSLIQENMSIQQTVDRPKSPGLFTPDIRPNESGEYLLVFELNAPGLSQRIEAGSVMVFSDDGAAAEYLSTHEQAEPEINFSKEQAWNTKFQTAPVRSDTLFGMVKLAGKWMSNPETQRTLNAGTTGNVMFAVPGLVEGVAVSQGQVLMQISGEGMNVSSIESDVRKAKAVFDQAKNEYDRKNELHELKIVPTAEFEEVTKRYELAEANYQQLLKNYSTKGIAIRAPFDGYIKRLTIENGAFAKEGQALMVIGSGKSKMIETAVAPSMRSTITETKKIWIMQPGKERLVEGEVISVGKNVTSENPLLPVFIEIKSPIDAVEGSFVEVQLGHSNGQVGLMIPKDALLEEFGTYKVIVQTGGESFEIRSIEIGAFNGNQVNVIRGLAANEWVVTKGSYQVKMASMSGIPEHGHSH